MGQLNISIPGFVKPDLFKRTPGSSREKGFKAHFPSEKADQDRLRDLPDKHDRVSARQESEAQCKPIELRIIQDGRIYRSKAEEERLVALGQWHHRRQRRRERMRR